MFNKNTRKSLRSLFSAIVAIFLTTGGSLIAQTIYSTNFGTAAVNTTTLLAGPPAWTRSGANAANLQLLTTSASLGYAGASATANLADNAGTGVSIVTTGDISTVGYTAPS